MLKVFDFERQWDLACKGAFAIEIENRFNNLESLHSANNWGTFKEESLKDAGRTF